MLNLFLKKNHFIKYSLLLTFLFLFVFSFSESATVEELQEQISKIEENKQQIEREIAEYEAQLKTIGAQATSLKNTIKSLDATINKNSLDIKLAQNKINTTELEIDRLSIDIGKNTEIIDKNTEAIIKLIREVNMAGDNSLVENFLAYNNLSELWNELEYIFQIQNDIRLKTIDTKNTKVELEDNKDEAEEKKAELIKLRSTLLDKQKVLEISKKEKNTLLSQTKNSETAYKKMLAEKQALAEAFNKELLLFESELKFVLDENSVPSANNNILNWPLDKIRVTQKFGITEFSKTTNAYGGGGHNGVDFAAIIGTPVKASLSGVVKGVGDTDIVCRGASYGKWVFIEHPNGLSTIYAHLSLIKVSKGQTVSTGDVIGYSGNTGFSTGPHLHFGLYNTQGVQIMSKKSSVCKGTYTIPVADLRAYLDPLLYLPRL